jgi:hypothetical protein
LTDAGDKIKTRKQALQDEFDDLEEEFVFSGNREARCRCAGRMGAILSELAVLLCLGTGPRSIGTGAC